MHYVLIMALTCSAYFLNGMEPNGMAVVAVLPNTKRNHYSKADYVWFARQAYMNSQHDLALENFKRGRPESVEIFKKINEIEDVEKRKSTLQRYGHYLFASSQCDYLKTIPGDDQVYINFLEQSLIPSFEMILEKAPDNEIEKEIVDKTLKKISTDCRWVNVMDRVDHAYNDDRPYLASAWFKYSVKDKEPSELLTQINSMENEQKRENALRGYYHYWCGLTMIDRAVSEKENPQRQQAIARAFRHALAIKLDSQQARQVMVDTVAKLKKLKTERSLYATWELMRFFFNVKKFDKAFDELSAATFWKDYGGFHYSEEQRSYLFSKDTIVDEINNLDLESIIPNNYKRAIALHEISQLSALRIIYKNNIKSNALKDPLQKAKQAISLFSVLLTVSPDEILDPSCDASFKWWASILKLEEDCLVLQESIKGQSKGYKKSKILWYVKDHSNMNIQYVRNFINTILDGNKEITERDFLKENNSTIKRIFAFKKFIHEDSSVADKKQALESLRVLAETDIYAANMLGILCTHPQYSFLNDPTEAYANKLIGIAALLKVYTEVSTQKPKFKLDIPCAFGNRKFIYNYDVALERYFPVLGNPYIHADLADAYVNSGVFGKMYEHLEDMFKTCYLAEKTPEFLSRKINSILGTLSTQLSIDCDGGKEMAEEFISDMRNQLLERNVQIENLENYGKFMAKITTTNNNRSNT